MPTLSLQLRCEKELGAVNYFYRKYHSIKYQTILINSISALSAERNKEGECQSNVAVGSLLQEPVRGDGDKRKRHSNSNSANHQEVKKHKNSNVDSLKKKDANKRNDIGQYKFVRLLSIPHFLTTLC